MKFNLAQVNVAKMLGPIDSPVMADFVNNLDPINLLAEQSKGFVWRLKDDVNDNATSIQIFDDKMIIVNLSVWEDVDSLFEFAYKSLHTGVLKRKSEWFEKMKEMHMAMWYIPEAHHPTVKEAEERLVHLRTHGETQHAFTFKKRFPAP